MTWLTGLVVLLVVTVCVSSAQEEDILEVLYPQKTFTPDRGSSIKLTCEAHYDFVNCNQVHVVWHQTSKDYELTDPSKYFTTVNETVTEGNTRRRQRQVVTEICDLTPEDNGPFRCKAKCLENGETAIGHLIKIIVKDAQ